MSSRSPIAIVGMACRYPDAKSPGELWENALAQRRAFRRIPASRLRHEDYYSADRSACDSIYTVQAAVIEGYEFDRHRFNISGSTYRSVDLAHWLALDIAAAAIDDAGFEQGKDLPRQSTGVLVGNTLTGEFSRANLLRTRWPYVRRMVEFALASEEWDAQKRGKFLADLEKRYKAPFPPGNEETLAGGLSNTIAGRICNYFDLKGGGYTVDGACASSLLAVVNACALLSGGELDLALAGGVDLSLDPFELVGFSRAGALAEQEMRVFDVRSQGFWPGEGCGFVALMRQADAIKQGRRIYATIRGWGVSSDGAGGITRPEVDGQVLCLQRAYQGLEFSVADVAYFEGHGTGTAVGDATELKALATARRQAGTNGKRAVVSSIKANIGHTKAAAGVAGVIKAAMGLSERILPPTTGCGQPHGEFSEADSSLQILRSPRAWPEDTMACAGVSAMGFGGINSHLALQGDSAAHRRARAVPMAQDFELLLFDADDAAGLRGEVSRLREIAPDLSRCEIGDLAAMLAPKLAGRKVRAAIVAADAAGLVERLDLLLEWLKASPAVKFDVSRGVFFGAGRDKPRIGFLCPGQGHGISLDGGAVARRFATARKFYEPALCGDVHSPLVVQPAVVRASLAAMGVLESLGIGADLAVGHSLGELTALCWAGAFDEKAILELALTRARLMTALSAGEGAMASIGANPAQVAGLCDGVAVSVACHNGPRQTVISGSASGVRAVVGRAQERRIPAVILKTTHAFHSPLVAPAGKAFPAAVAELGAGAIRRNVISTVTAELLTDSEKIPELLGRQITSPVLFVEAIKKASALVDLFVEVGSGDVLSRMVSELTDVPALSVDVGGESLAGLLGAVGASFAMGADVSYGELFRDRLVRPFSLDWKPRFFANPCESAPILEEDSTLKLIGMVRESEPAVTEIAATSSTAIDILRQIIATQEELKPESIQPGSHLLRDLHLNSLKVAEIVAKACRRMGLAMPVSPTEMSGATLGQIATALEDQKRVMGVSPAPVALGHDSAFPPGVDSWVRAFNVDWVLRGLEQEREERAPQAGRLNGNGMGQNRSWEVFGGEDYPFAAALKNELSAKIQQGGVALCLNGELDRRSIGPMLSATQAAIARFSAESPGVFVVAHRGGGAGLAKTLSLECPGIDACVVDVPADHPEAAKWVAVEAAAARGYCESRYDSLGRRWIPVLSARAPANGAAMPDIGLSSRDVVLVSGGGKGIAAECALEIAGQSGAGLVILGRSRPEDDAELAGNLARLASRGLRFEYQAADVTDAEAVRYAVRQGQEQMGQVTAILHGAGTNVPQLLSSLDEETFFKTLGPKQEGLNNLLSAVGAGNLKLLVTFGSVIARIGMRGEADYAVANEWMGQAVERFGEEHPGCRCLNLEWSVWSGVGMGPRLGSITPLMAQGITPITPDAGVRKLLELLRDPGARGSIIVSGRYGDLSTLKSETKFRPGRFTQTARCFYPGVELVADTVFSSATDPYLADHVFRGRRLLPGVVGLEMMAAAAGVVSTRRIGAMDKVRFDHPIEIPADGKVVLRVAALVRDDGEIEVMVRSSASKYAVNHFSAVCREDGLTRGDVAREDWDEPAPTGSAAQKIDPKRDLYGGILFQGKTFQRIAGYDLLRARQCIARIAPGDANDGLGERDDLILGDPAGRDAAIHAIQACIPHITVLPVSIERMEVFARAKGTCRLMARERSSDSTGFVYDLIVKSEGGEIVERWTGLRLQIALDHKLDGAWPAGLLVPYFERRMGDLLPGMNPIIQWEFDGHGERGRHRPDGKPDKSGRHCSSTHLGEWRISCAADKPVGFDAQVTGGRSAEQWAEVLGLMRMELAGKISQSARESLARSAGRVWCAMECLVKIGSGADAPLTFSRATADGWVMLESGKTAIASYFAAVEQMGEACFAVATGQKKQKAYEFRVRVGFDEVNRMGTVNFQSYFNWQARCREAFLHDHAPQVIHDLHNGAVLVTTGASCDYAAEIDGEREVLIRMTLGDLGEHQLTMRFEYVQESEGAEVIVARGEQTTASMRRSGAALVPVAIPGALRAALSDFI